MFKAGELIRIKELISDAKGVKVGDIGIILDIDTYFNYPIKIELENGKIIRVLEQEIERITISEINLSFEKALELMLVNGVKVKLPEWDRGYWCYKNDTIMIYTDEGMCFDIRQSADIAYTLFNTFRKDWRVISE